MSQKNKFSCQGHKTFREYCMMNSVLCILVSQISSKLLTRQPSQALLHPTDHRLIYCHHQLPHSVCSLECEMQIFWTSVQAAWELITIVQDKWEGRGISLKAQRGIRTYYNKFLCIWWNSSICDIKYTNQKFSFHVLAMGYSCNLLNLKVAKSVQLQFFYPKDLDHHSSSNTLNDWRYVHTVHRFRNPRVYPNLAWFEVPIAPKDSKAHQLTKLWKMIVPTVPTQSSWV
jgi:hypothetical protein